MFKVHSRRIGIFIIMGLIVALFYASTVPKLYEAKAIMLMDNSEQQALNVSEEVGRILRTGYSSNIGTELALLSSEPIFYQAAQAVALKNPQWQGALRDPKDLFSMYQIGANAGLVQITAKANDPNLAAELANGVYSVYSEVRDAKARDSITTSLRWLQEQVAVAKKELMAQEQRIRQFREREKIVSADAATANVASYISSLEKDRDAAQTEIRTLQAQISTQQAKLRLLPDYESASYSLEKTPIVASLEARLADLQQQRLIALKDYRDDSTRVKSIEALISSLEKKLVAEQKNQWQQNSRQFQKDPIRSSMESGLAANQVTLNSLQAKLREANNLLGQQDQLMKQMPGKELQFTQLLRERNQMERNYNMMRTQLEDMRIKSRSTLGDAQIIDFAKPKDEAVAPDIAKMGIFGAIAGACLGILFSFIYEALRLPVRSSGQLTELTGLPVAATVPLMPRRRAKKMLAGLPSPDAKPSESFRFMAFSQLAREGGAPKIVMFTGIGGAVGCSSAAGQFALATAQTGVRTLLVDCDLRHPAITTAFEVNDKSGLSDMLNRTMLHSDSTDLAIETAHDHLKVIPAGTDSGQTGGLAEFPTSHIIGIIESMKGRADVIVLDAPPCDVVSDASRLVPYVDQVNLVISAASTSFRSVPIAYELLRRAGAKEINMILTHSSPQDEPFTKRSKYMVTNR